MTLENMKKYTYNDIKQIYCIKWSANNGIVIQYDIIPEKYMYIIDLKNKSIGRQTHWKNMHWDINKILYFINEEEEKVRWKHEFLTKDEVKKELFLLKL